MHEPNPIAAPGSILVIPPREMQADELRCARLEQYLEAEFPNLDFQMNADGRLAGPHCAISLRPPRDGAPAAAKGDADTVARLVLDAMQAFVEYGQRLH